VHQKRYRLKGPCSLPVRHRRRAYRRLRLWPSLPILWYRRGARTEASGHSPQSSPSSSAGRSEKRPPDCSLTSSKEVPHSLQETISPWIASEGIVRAASHSRQFISGAISLSFPSVSNRYNDIRPRLANGAEHHGRCCADYSLNSADSFNGFVHRDDVRTCD